MTVLRRLPRLGHRPRRYSGERAAAAGDESAVPDGAPEEASSFADEWPTPNGDLGNRRVATSEIDAGNVDELGVAWTVPIKGGGTFGNYASTPIIADGVVYTQDLTSNVKAIDLETGDVKWSKDYNSPTVGPNGVTIGYDKVYGATSDFAFALDIETGEEVWRSEKLTRNANEGIDMAPAVFDDTLYVSTVPGNTKSFYKGNGAGVLWALDAGTGEGAMEVLDRPARTSGAASTPRSTAAADSGIRPHSTTTATSTSRSQIRRRGRARTSSRGARAVRARTCYTNSVVKLNREDGKVIWHRQVLAHDVYDWDLQLPPILTRGRRPQARARGRQGRVRLRDRRRGRHDRVAAARRRAQRPRQGQRDRPPGQLRPDAEASADAAPGHPRRRRDADGRRRRCRLRADREHPDGLQDAGEVRPPDREGHRRDGRAQRQRRLAEVEARPRATCLRRRDGLERPRLHDDVRGQADRARPRGRERRLGAADARRHERDGRDRRGHARDRGELPAEQGPEAGDHRLPARRDRGARPRRRPERRRAAGRRRRRGGRKDRSSPRTAAAATRSARPGRAARSARTSTT